MIMNKKVYLQPQIKCAPLPMENLLASWSKPETESKTDPDNPPIGPGNGGLGGKDDLDSKEHFTDFDSWDSWD